MRKLILTALTITGAIIAALAFIWFVNPGVLRDRTLTNLIVNMRVAPKRLDNPKTPSDYGMKYRDVDLTTADNIRLSAWEIPAMSPNGTTLIVNHPLTTTKYGSTKGLDGVSVEFLPMIKHLHDAGYNVLTYDHRGQGDSDGGLGKTKRGTEAPVGAGVTEWQDVVASIDYIKSHSIFGQDKISLISQCMGANATFLAFQKRPDLLNPKNIESLVAIQPTLSYNMTARFIQAKLGVDIVDKVLKAQLEKFGFGFANALETVPSVTVPVLYAQVEKDGYTFNTDTGKNDLVEIMKATTTQHETVWIGPDQAKPFGSGKRFDGYGYFNKYPEELLAFLAK